MNAAAVRPGDTVAGKYRVEYVLGSGGMGVVVAARHLEMDQLVAVKFLLPEHAGKKDLVERFIREGRRAAKLRTEHVCRVLDVGRLAEGAPFIVMEHLEGFDLARYLRQRGPLPVREAVELVLQAAEAIAEAHALGIVHRDLKPHNLFLTTGPSGEPLVKVLDFGVAKAQEPGAHATRSEVTMGSPAYMPPEQARAARNAEPRSDQYALGVILYQLLTNRLPFESESVPLLYVDLLTSPPTPARKHRPELPVELEAILARTLQKEVTARYASLAELAAALAPFAGVRAQDSVEAIGRLLHRSVERSAPSDAGLVAPQPLADTVLASSDAPPTTRTPRRWPWLVLAAGLIAAIAGFWPRPAPETPALIVPAVELPDAAPAAVDAAPVAVDAAPVPDAAPRRKRPAPTPAKPPTDLFDTAQ
jgi:serine/threonine-protein kinase